MLKDSQSKHWAKKNLKIIESYWVSPPATKRSLWFVEQLKNYEFKSIWEVGFFSGRNLRYIKEAFPDVWIGGIDVNPAAVKFAKSKLGNQASLCECDIHTMSDINGVDDIVFTSGVLIHIPPENLKDAVKELLGRATKYVMNMEQLGNSELIAGPKELKPMYKESDQLQWNCDLIAVYKELGYDPQIIELPKDCQTNGAKELVVIKK